MKTCSKPVVRGQVGTHADKQRQTEKKLLTTLLAKQTSRDRTNKKQPKKLKTKQTNKTDRTNNYSSRRIDKQADMQISKHIGGQVNLAP